MCGFGGVVNSSFIINETQIRGVANQVSHRGPDYTGVAFFNDVFEPQPNSGSSAFFFNRLAILDLNIRSNQPYQDDRYLLLFNGEIYNYRTLREELRKNGATFKTTSDTEVLFYALQAWGRGALSRLNGMFSFFWFDKKEQKFLAARDRVGIKPLYYRVEGAALIFGSELTSVMRMSNTPADIDRSSIDSYLCLQYVPTPHTIFQDIYKVPPGHFVEGSVADLKARKSIRTSSFWDAYQLVLTSDNRPDGMLEQIITESIRLQLEADVPLGLFLSSGVDSSLLAALINKHFHDRTFDFFTVSYEEATASDESREALEYLEGFNNSNLRHHKLTLSASSISSRLNTLYRYFDEPFGDPAALLNWAISEKAREHVTVVLSGDGADELFWGYPRYSQWAAHRNMLHKKLPLISCLKKPLSVLPPSWTKYTLLNSLETDPVKIYFDILRPRRFGFLPPVNDHTDLWCLQGLETLKQRNDLASIIDLKGYLPDAMLYKVDRSSMASSLEVRVPYLDNNVVDYALKLSLNKKSTPQLRHKAPLKELLKKLAPHYDTSRSKKGFNFPLEDWLRNDWKEMVLDLITKDRLETLGLPAQPFMDIVNNFFSKGGKSVNEIWYLFNLVLWHHTFKSTKTDR